MRITNTTNKTISLTDLDRGNAGSNDPNTGVYESWNTKGYTVIPANDFKDVFDSDNSMLSAELGQLRTFKDAGDMTTEYSLTGKSVGDYTLSGANNQFTLTIAGGGTQAFTFPTGTVTMTQVVNTINATASGFVAEESVCFFRSSNTDNTIKGEVDGDIASGEGQRTEAITGGFLVLVSSGIIEIGVGSANDVLGYYEKQKTLAK